MSYVLRFDDPAALAPAASGGKGANLARLTQAGMPVPTGVVVTASAYDLFALAAREVLAGARSLPFDQPDALEREAEAMIARLVAVPVPPTVERALREGVAALGVEGAYSVRSSATTEDLGGAAFAGQHETFLHCIGADDIVDKLRRCWASLWSGRAVAYRHNAGFDVEATSMAVVVQRMAFCDVAGVAFSMNPVTGNLGEQVFDANFGLGESVVGGEVLVDHFVVEKASGKLLSQDIAAKTVRVVAREDGSGTREEEIPGAQSTAPSLDKAQLDELSAMLRRVEQVYGYPQDVEWGFEAGRLWLLQSRPVTRIPARWTRDESAERFPSVITPLAWALVEEGFHKSLNHSFALMGLPPFRDKWFAMFDHYIYGNQNAVEVYANGAASSIHIGSAAELMAAIPVLREQYGWVQELPVLWARDLDHYLMSIGELMAEPLEGRSILDLWGYVLRVKDLGADYFLPNIAISITQRTLYRLLLGIAQQAVGAAQAPAVFDRLLAYCETKTGVINKELYRLAERIDRNPPLRDRLRGTDARGFLDEGGFGADPELECAFAKFLRDHGHREVEFDPYHPTWVEAPWLVVENVRAMLDSRREDPARKERELKLAMQEAEHALLESLPHELRFFVHEVLRLARIYTTLDDVEHYKTTRLTLPFRRGLRALGGRLSARGVLDEPMDVFFASYPMLDEAAHADRPELWERLGAAVREEKAAYLRHRGEAPAWEWGRVAAPAAPAAGALKGLAGSAGLATGPVFRVFSADDFASFPKGAVLVARTTNPAWTPLFYKACAVVTESGGPLSHGAVTAREIGLPAVMSVRDALSLLREGQTVTVDGSSGIVRV